MTMARDGNPTSLWSESREVLDSLRGRISSQSFKTWIELIVPQKLDRNVLFIQVPSQFFYDWLEEHYYTLLSEVLSKCTGLETLIEYSNSRTILISPGPTRCTA